MRSLLRNAWHASLFFLMAFVLLLSMERRAHAYADPGSSLVAFQSLGSLVLGVMYYFRKRIAQMFGKTPQTKDIPAEKNAAGEENVD